MATDPKWDTFNPQDEPWDTYVERFEIHCEVYDIEDGNQQASTLLDAVGAPTLKLIKRATAPREPTELKFKELIVTIERFLDNAPQSTRDHYRGPKQAKVTQAKTNCAQPHEALRCAQDESTRQQKLPNDQQQNEAEVEKQQLLHALKIARDKEDDLREGYTAALDQQRKEAEAEKQQLLHALTIARNEGDDLREDYTAALDQQQRSFENAMQDLSQTYKADIQEMRSHLDEVNEKLSTVKAEKDTLQAKNQTLVQHQVQQRESLYTEWSVKLQTASQEQNRLQELAQRTAQSLLLAEGQITSLQTIQDRLKSDLETNRTQLQETKSALSVMHHDMEHQRQEYETRLSIAKETEQATLEKLDHQRQDYEARLSIAKEMEKAKLEIELEQKWTRIAKDEKKKLEEEARRITLTKSSQQQQTDVTTENSFKKVKVKMSEETSDLVDPMSKEHTDLEGCAQQSLQQDNELSPTDEAHAAVWQVPGASKYQTCIPDAIVDADNASVIDYFNSPTEVWKYITIGDERGISPNQPLLDAIIDADNASVTDYFNSPTEVQKYITMGDERRISSNQPFHAVRNFQHGLQNPDGRVITGETGEDDKASPEDCTAEERSRNSIQSSAKPAVNRTLACKTPHNVHPLVKECFDPLKRLGPGFRPPVLTDYQRTRIQLVVRIHTQPVIKWCKSQSFHKNKRKRGTVPWVEEVPETTDWEDDSELPPPRPNVGSGRRLVQETSDWEDASSEWRRIGKTPQSGHRIEPSDSFRKRRIGKTTRSCHRLDPSDTAVRTLSPSHYHRLEPSNSPARALSPSMARGTGQETGMRPSGKNVIAITLPSPQTK